MRCALCQRELDSGSLTGGLVKYRCPDCRVYYIEWVDTPNLEDLANVIQQVVRKEPMP